MACLPGISLDTARARRKLPQAVPMRSSADARAKRSVWLGGLTPRQATLRLPQNMKTDTDIQAPTLPALASASGSDAVGQLKCPKCKSLRLNVHASDIIAANGVVTCSECGHTRIIKSLSAAKLLTSPFQKCGQGKREICAASPPEKSRHQNAKLTDQRGEKM